MRKNPMVSPSRMGGTPSQGNAAPLANMPANNNGTFSVKTGAGQSSKFGQGVGPSASQGGTVQSSTGGKANTPAKNKATTSVPLGTTHHGVGGVPGYLKGRH